LLRACWQRLVPGGALVIHEVVPPEAAARVDDLQFERDELIRLVSENAAPPGYLSMTDASLLAEFGHGGSGALLAVKPRAGAMSPSTPQPLGDRPQLQRPRREGAARPTGEE